MPDERLGITNQMATQLTNASAIDYIQQFDAVPSGSSISVPGPTFGFIAPRSGLIDSAFLKFNGQAGEDYRAQVIYGSTLQRIACGCI